MKRNEENFSLTNTTKGKLPSLPFSEMKNAVLGKSYILSLVFITEQKSKELNSTYRKKNKGANVLSFPLSKKEGEIFICVAVAKRQCKDFDKTWQKFVGFLVIHGMLHLKGYDHSSIMESLEKKYDQKYLSRN
ncbi:MAG: rRNA maturation RNase YbeY [Candidatus Nomurabacteria bacterium]|nr:rRNA maturation RNase YbeY [Candidatus Nomurabacteria bacterium]